MSEKRGSATPLVSQGSRVGPLFCTKDQCAFVQMSKSDDARAVVNTTSMTLVDYADRSEYPEGTLRSDQSLFVPILCEDCYGTEEGDYAEALTGIASCGSGKFLVGVCSVFGVAQGEVYPEGRRDFLVGNDTSYSGACHPQPGKAVFLHKAKKDIGRVKCYWHVHSRSADKTFLYCCVALDNDEYTNGVVNPADASAMSMAFSLGTVGNNEKGAVTEECSLVSVPMRPGCFCLPVTSEHLAQTMTRMGFCTLKDSALDAGVPPVESSDEGLGDISETVGVLRKAVLDQAAELRALKDVLEAIKVQNSVLTQRLKRPEDPDALFTVQGAKDFTKRTGVKTKLCAGDTNGGVWTDTQAPKVEQSDDTMAATQTQIDTLIKLLQQQQQQQQPQPQQQPQQQYQQSQQAQQLQALQSFMQLAPVFQHLAPQPQTQEHGWIPRQQQHRAIHNNNNNNMTSGASNPGETVAFQYGSLTEEQRRKIAIEYNKQESERQAVNQKEQERMLDSIKASLRDVMSEKHRGSSSTQDPSGYRSVDAELQSLARETPYKRVRKDNKADPDDISTLMNELRKLTKQLSKQGGGDQRAGDESESGQLAMDTEDAHNAASSDDQQATQRSNPEVAKKQQAGYSAPSSDNKSMSVSDFISAVVTKK